MVFSVLQKHVWVIQSCPKNFLSGRMSQANFGRHESFRWLFRLIRKCKLPLWVRSKVRGREVALLSLENFRGRFVFRDGPLEKLSGGGGGGEFSSRRNFFSLSNSLYEFILGHSMNIFQDKLACKNFFSFNFPLREDFFCTSSAPPHQFSNGPSLTPNVLGDLF